MKSKMHKRTLGFAIGLGLLAAGSVSSQAATFTQSANVIASGSTGSASVQKFDASLGTLNSVLINYDLAASFRVLYRNYSTSAQTATIGVNTLYLRGHDPDGILGTENQYLRGSSFGGDYTINGARTLGSVTIPTTTTLDFGFSFVRSFDSQGITLGSGSTLFDFSPNRYAGPGDFDFNFNLALNSALSLSGLMPLIAPFSPSLSGTVTATYDYTEAVAAVPVPAALPLLAVALGGLGFLGARRRKAS